jgi:hypothetical protein
MCINAVIVTRFRNIEYLNIICIDIYLLISHHQFFNSELLVVHDTQINVSHLKTGVPMQHLTVDVRIILVDSLNVHAEVVVVHVT